MLNNKRSAGGINKKTAKYQNSIEYF